MQIWDTSDLDGLIGDLQRAPEKTEALCKVVVSKTGLDTVAYAQDLAPEDTGHLKSTIDQEPIKDGWGFQADASAEYAAAVEYGSRAHVIRAKNKKALFWEGAEHPVRQVNHPGTSPQPYMRPGFEKAIEPIDDILAQVGIKVLT